MKKKSKTVKEGWPNHLGLQDYDFTGVPEAELDTCVYYEYAREFKAVASQAESLKLCLDRYQKLSEQLRNATAQSFTEPDPNNALEPDRMFSALLFTQLASCKFFPRSCWQELSPEDKEQTSLFVTAANGFRNKGMQLVNRPILLVRIPDGRALNVSTEGLHKLKSLVCPGSPENLMCGAFIMNVVDYDAAELADNFSWFIQTAFQVPATRKRGRQGSSRDSLNRLMALRLRYMCPGGFPQASDKLHGLRDASKGTDYVDLAAFSRACTGAAHRFQEMFSLPSSELPFHYVEGWGPQQNIVLRGNPGDRSEQAATAAITHEPAPIRERGACHLPLIGEEVSYTGPSSYLPTDEASLLTLLSPMPFGSPLFERYHIQQIDCSQLSDAEIRTINEYYVKNRDNLIGEGKMIKLDPGVRIRIVGYYVAYRGLLRPCPRQERHANFVKMEVLEGEAKHRTALVSTDSIKRF